MQRNISLSLFLHLVQKIYIVALDFLARRMSQLSQERRFKLHSIQWKDLSLKNTKQDKQLLTDLHGCVKSGEFLSIMGPSGSGKSSLLSIITLKLYRASSKLQKSGEVLLDGLEYNRNTFSKLSSYVQQDDLLFGTLTVRQLFYFYANLRLWRLDILQRQKKCQKILKKINLFQCADRLIGNSQFKKSISCGQKRRVSIGLELISNPSILVLDQPTSGLDSHNALIIVKLLARLARVEKRLVITTIHQPSTLIFQIMDQLYLLEKGCCVYQGSANKIINYMCQLGININYKMNPADFFMMQISQFKHRLGYKSPLNQINYQKRLHNKSLKNSQSQPYELQSQKSSFFQQITPFTSQFKPLLKRSFVSFYRLPSNQLNKLSVIFLIPLTLGLMFFKIGQEVPDSFNQMYFLKLLAFWYMGMYFVFSLNVYDTTLIFPLQKQIVLKEVSSDLYSIPVYFFTRMLSELPGCVIPTMLCGIAMFFISAMEISFDRFVVFVGLFMLTGLVGYFFGLFFGVLCKDQITAIILLPMVLLPILIFGGPAVNINTIPPYIRWLQYLSPVRHSVLIIFQDQMKSKLFKNFQSLNLPEHYGLGGDYNQAVICLFALMIGYIVLSILLLYLFKKRRV